MNRRVALALYHHRLPGASRSNIVTFQDTYSSPNPDAASEARTESRNVICSLGKNTYDNHPRRVTFERFEAFRSAVLRVNSPKKGLAYLCSPMGGDGRRCKDNTSARRWLPFDLDGIADGEAFSELTLWFQRFNG
jgi:hypothetical protein